MEIENFTSPQIPLPNWSKFLYLLIGFIFAMAHQKVWPMVLEYCNKSFTNKLSRQRDGLKPKAKIV